MLHTKYLFLPLFAVAALSLSAQTVRFDTSLGGIDVVLTPDVTPQTVANFMAYVNSGEYNNTIIHRSLNAAENASNGFYLIQGGGYIVKNHLPFLFQPNAPVMNEFKASNVRGSLAMALQGTDINSAQDEWYFNTSDNSGSLDSQSFTVFGNVANDASLAVMDSINAVQTFTFDTLTNFPLLNYTTGHTVVDSNYLYVNSIAPITPTDSAPGVVSAATFASSSTNGISPGEVITVFGNELGPTQLSQPLTLNSAGLLDATLQGTQVLFNGVPGPMVFTQSGQLAVVTPYGIANAGTVNVVVSYLGIQTAPLQFKVVSVNPGLFTVNGSGKGDASIVRPVDSTLINSATPASAGDVLELYGEGYGAASPGLADGAIVAVPFNVPATLLIDGQKVDTLYAGGAGGEVNGILQVNFVVPQLTPGSHQIQIQVGSAISPSGVTLQTK
ncbi:MAG TPA: peptidylprolyl isomerase [Bryobacteraceae bacterium]|nr:peptidylprolyl isomerase [Bryobacteraceae bacterium]